MNRIEKLIAELCPNGVEWKKLGELGIFYNGLTGKSKNDFTNGNAKYVTYMNVYSNIEIDTNIESYVKINENEQQNRIEYGDVLFTGSSETPDECGISSVLTKHIDEPLYLNSFCFGFRLYDKSIFLPGFLKYLFRSAELRKKIGKTANGVTRFNVSKKLFSQIPIPIPPLPVQEEIVKILDTFTELEAELETQLEAELEARKKQYEYYRNKLLTPVEVNGRWYLNGKEVEWKKLGEVCDICSGGTPSKSKEEYWIKGDIPWLKSEVCNNKSVKSANNFINELGLKNSNTKLLKENTTLMALVGATIFKTAFLEFSATTNQNVAAIKSIEENKLKDKFIFYCLTNMYNDLKSKMNSYGMLNLSILRNFPIPIPPLSEQERIVAILDKFDALVNDLTSGLPAEIEARRKQYEYYRNKLLTF